VFDIIGKKRWFFTFSLLLTIPGLIFIFLTPLTGGKEGLKFTIDYTGGTRWEIRFQDPKVSGDDIRAVLAKQNLEATVVATSNGFYEIRTIPIGLSSPPPTATPVPSGSASASGGPSASAPGSAPASASPVASGSAQASASPAPSPSAGASASAAPSGSANPSASPSASPAAATGEIPRTGRMGQVVTALETDLGPIAQQRSLTTIGPVVSADLISQALVLILVGSIGILLWITFRFRDVKFGVTALVALLHDVIVVVGTFAVLGTLAGVQVDALFVTAMLTVIGFSVHDTIVVFDRIRENKARHAGEPFAEIVNHSILQTFGRSITTSFTVVLTLLALLLFGGTATTYFVLALLIGIVSGTYSSIFNAAPLLVVWQEYEDRQRGRLAPARTPRRATP
jgi:preprotein translocase SecF subunit